MKEPNEEQIFSALVQRFAPGSQFLRAWSLTGGVSAQVTALEFLQPDGHSCKALLRQHGVRDRQHNPQIATAEFTLLQILQNAGIAAPAPYYLDQAGEFFATPSLVMAYIDGAPEFRPADLSDYLHQAATHLAGIHRIDGTAQTLAFLPQQTKGFGARPATLDDTLDEERIREQIEHLWPIPQHNPTVLLHGDFWPGNLLWQDGQLAAVIDWEDAAIGDPLADLGNTRLELLWAFGLDAMIQFTQCYHARNAVDLTNLPYWDLCAALRPAGKLGTWGLDAATEKAMRADHQWFVTQAFMRLAERGS